MLLSYKYCQRFTQFWVESSRVERLILPHRVTQTSLMHLRLYCKWRCLRGRHLVCRDVIVFAKVMACAQFSRQEHTGATLRYLFGDIIKIAAIAYWRYHQLLSQYYFCLASVFKLVYDKCSSFLTRGNWISTVYLWKTWSQRGRRHPSRQRPFRKNWQRA